MLQVEVATSDKIKESHKIWNDLVKSMRFPTIFLTWEWVTTWLEHFGKGYRPIILFIYHQTDIVAIVPLVQRTMRLANGFLKVRTITFCGTMLNPDYLDIICAEQDANIYIEKTFEFLTSHYTAWDVLHFAFLAREGHLSSWLQSASGKYRIRLISESPSPFISMNKKDPSFFLGGFNRKKRYNLDREKKILFSIKNVTFKKIETSDDLAKGLEDLWLLHKARANEKGISSTFQGDSIFNFHQAIAGTFLELGWLRLYFLMNGGKAISSAYGFVFEKRFFYYQSGLDPEWQKFSPGKVLIFSILEDMFKDDILEFDFLGGNENYKTFWSKDFRSITTFNFYNESMTGIIENWANILRDMLKSMLLRMLPKGIIRFMRTKNCRRPA